MFERCLNSQAITAVINTASTQQLKGSRKALLYTLRSIDFSLHLRAA